MGYQNFKCFKCERDIEGDEVEYPDSYVVKDGVMFEGGHAYGSTLYDSLCDNKFVTLIVCDECLKKHKKLIQERMMSKMAIAQRELIWNSDYIEIIHKKMKEI